MSPIESSGADEPSEVLGDAADQQERSPAGYATVIGIVTGLFGALLAVGLILLPSGTNSEKLLIIGASLAISIAGLTGAGAWRSPRRFALTAVAGGLAIVCLADLSVAAARSAPPSHPPSAARRPTSQATVRSQPATSPATGAAATPATPPQPTSSAQPRGDFLSSMNGNAALGLSQEVAPETGPWSISNVEYEHSLGYPPELCNDQDQSVTYNLNGAYRYFTAEVGIADGASPEDQGAQVNFEVEGARNPGQFSELGSKSAQAGVPAQFNINIQGITQLELVTSVVELGACLDGSTAVWGNALVGP
jgi:NPCBM/NEW2 domain